MEKYREEQEKGHNKADNKKERKESNEKEEKTKNKTEEKVTEKQAEEKTETTGEKETSETIDKQKQEKEAPAEEEAPASADEETREADTEEKDEMEILQDKLEESWNKYVRLSAEFDNYRKRTLREKSELQKTAGEDVIKSILPVIDDFERALESMENTENIDAVKEGVKLIYNKLISILKEKGLEEIPAMNQEFSTDYHEAVTKVPVESKKQKGKVVDVVQKGYTLNDNVIRYSKVVVGE